VRRRACRASAGRDQRRGFVVVARIARVADPVTVAVGLVRVGDGRAVVDGIAETVAVLNPRRQVRGAGGRRAGAGSSGSHSPVEGGRRNVSAGPSAASPTEPSQVSATSQSPADGRTRSPPADVVGRAESPCRRTSRARRTRPPQAGRRRCSPASGGQSLPTPSAALGEIALAARPAGRRRFFFASAGSGVGARAPLGEVAVAAARALTVDGLKVSSGQARSTRCSSPRRRSSPATGRHSTAARLETYRFGQRALDPVQLSARSQSPAAGRHSAPAREQDVLPGTRPADTVTRLRDVAVAPVAGRQTSVSSRRPGNRRIRPGADSARSHGPQDGRHSTWVADVIQRASSRSAPVQNSATSQSPAAGRHSTLAWRTASAGQSSFTPRRKSPRRRSRPRGPADLRALRVGRAIGTRPGCRTPVHRQSPAAARQTMFAPF